MSKKIKIAIAVNGRFHSYDVASELLKTNNLDYLITTYPYFKIKEWSIPKRKIKNLVTLEVLNRISRFFPNVIRDYLMYFQKILFDIYVTIHLKRNTDFLLTWSGDCLFALKRAKKLGIKTIVERSSCHILEQKKLLKEEYKLQGLKYNFMNNLYISRELKGYELSDYVTIPSNFVYRSFIMNGFNSKKLFLNNLGVSLIQFTNKNLKKNKFIIIYVGLLSFQKGSHYLLEAIYDLLVNQNINLEFWHVGKVSNEIENIKLKYQHKKIIYKGYVKQKELVNYYNESSVFVMPSIQEGMASVQLQAMACGLPIISTTNTGGDDLISNNEEGFIIPIRDVTSLKEKILFFYNNRDYAEKMGKRALKKVSSGFTWNEYSRRLLDKLEMIKN